MKKRSIELSIDEPCHEDWGKMTPNEQGRFCDSCAKPVIDFSTASDVEIIRYMDEHKGEKTCGRFNVNQLDRPMKRPLPDKIYSGFSLRSALLGATLSSLLGLESCKSEEPVVMGEVAAMNATEQPVKGVQPIQSESMLQGKVIVNTYDHKDEKLMSGYVTGYDGKTIPDAKLILFSENDEEISKVNVRKDGSFRLELNWDKKPDYVKVSAPEYADKLINLETTAELQEMKIVLARHKMKQGAVMRKEG